MSSGWRSSVISDSGDEVVGPLEDEQGDVVVNRAAGMADHLGQQDAECGVERRYRRDGAIDGFEGEVVATFIACLDDAVGKAEDPVTVKQVKDVLDPLTAESDREPTLGRGEAVLPTAADADRL